MIALLVTLGTLWAQPNACGDLFGFATSTDLVYLEGHTVVARAIETGDKHKLVDLPSDLEGAAIVAITSDRIVVQRKLTLVAFDLTGARRWKQAGGIVHGSGGTIAVALARDADVAVRLVDVESGKERWSTTIDVAGALRSVVIGTKLVLVTIDSTIHARWLDDGTPAWTFSQRGNYQNLVGDDLLLTGAQAKLVVGGTATDLGIAAHRAGVHGSHAYLSTDQGLVAIDLRDQHTEWTSKLGGAFRLATDTYVVVEERDVLHVLDASSGTLVSDYAIHPLTVQAPNGRALLACEDDKTLIAIDPTGKDDIANVTGTLRCKHCTSVALAGVDAPVDDKGHFSLDVAGRGTFELRANGKRVTDVKLGGKRSIELGTLDAN